MSGAPSWSGWRTHGHVVALDRDTAALGWTAEHRAVEGLAGDATDEQTLQATVDRASQAGTLTGWVNNAAVFKDAALHDTPVAEVLELITINLGLAVAGSAAAIRRFLSDGKPGAIVNVSSHQAQRAVPGALPYATAKAAIEWLTRALAVDYAPRGIRVNAVALGSIVTERYDERLDPELRRLHPLGRAGRGEEVAAVVDHLLSGDASFVTGAAIAVDGGRAGLGQDPEARRHRQRLGLTAVADQRGQFAVSRVTSGPAVGHPTRPPRWEGRGDRGRRIPCFWGLQGFEWLVGKRRACRDFSLVIPTHQRAARPPRLPGHLP